MTKDTALDTSKNKAKKAETDTISPESLEKPAKKVRTKKLNVNKAFEKAFKKPKRLLVGLVILGLGLGCVALYISYSRARNELNTVSQNARIVSTDLLTNVEMLAEVPEDEIPTVATITDVKKLEGQRFFERAENGDKLLIYQKSKRAILYRPSSNKIVEAMRVGLGNLENLQEGSNASDEVVQSVEPIKVKVAVYNSTAVAGLAGSLSERIEQEFSAEDFETEIVDVGDAVGTYAEGFVVVLGDNTELQAYAEDLAKYLNIEVSTLPNTEETPEADIVVFIGQL